MLNIQNDQVFGKDSSARAIAVNKEKGSERIIFTAQLATEVLYSHLDYFHGNIQNVKLLKGNFVRLTQNVNLTELSLRDCS